MKEFLDYVEKEREGEKIDVMLLKNVTEILVNLNAFTTRGKKEKKNFYTSDLEVSLVTKHLGRIFKANC